MPGEGRGREKGEIALPVPGPPPAKEKEEVPSATKSKSREALLCLLGDGHALAEPVSDGRLGLGRCKVALAVDVGEDGPHDGAVEHLCALQVRRRERGAKKHMLLSEGES